jgi:hypothetical protein
VGFDHFLIPFETDPPAASSRDGTAAMAQEAATDLERRLAQAQRE